jgi:Mrp family chromosome partitioning ATPase
MFAISLVWQKGGVGKITIALGLAVAAAVPVMPPQIIDLDLRHPPNPKSATKDSKKASDSLLSCVSL